MRPEALGRLYRQDEQVDPCLGIRRRSDLVELGLRRRRVERASQGHGCVLVGCVPTAAVGVTVATERPRNDPRLPVMYDPAREVAGHLRVHVPLHRRHVRGQVGKLRYPAVAPLVAMVPFGRATVEAWHFAVV